MADSENDLENITVDENRKPRKTLKREKKRTWPDDDVEVLIESWATKEILFNVKHELYFNKNERQKALEKVKNELDDLGIAATEKEITEKMTALRTYYGAETRKSKSGDGADDVYISKWKFYKSLSFLKDSIIPRQTQSNLDSTDMLFSPSFPPSDKTKRKMASKSSETAHILLEKTLDRLDNLNNNKENKVDNSRIEKTEDDILCELLLKMLQSIPEGPEKAMFRLELQQKVIMFKYNSHTSTSSTGTNPGFTHTAVPRTDTNFAISEPMSPTFGNRTSPMSPTFGNRTSPMSPTFGNRNFNAPMNTNTARLFQNNASQQSINPPVTDFINTNSSSTAHGIIPQRPLISSLSDLSDYSY